MCSLRGESSHWNLVKRLSPSSVADQVRHGPHSKPSRNQTKHQNHALIMTLLFIGGVEIHPGPCHMESRRKVCAVCMLKSAKTKYGGYRTVNEKQETKIRDLVNKVYSKDNLCLPSGLCDSCRMKLDRNHKFTKFPNYAEIFTNGSIKWTRDRENEAKNCACKICEVGAASLFQYRKMVEKWKGERESVCVRECVCERVRERE